MNNNIFPFCSNDEQERLKDVEEFWCSRFLATVGCLFESFQALFPNFNHVRKTDIIKVDQTRQPNSSNN